jgi:cytochrome c biogenesis protein CcmG/thiol:disulfide interchange protein DsbE
VRFAGRGVAVVVAAALVGLLIYGVVAKSPNTKVDDSLSKGKPIAAPTFTLASLQTGAPGPKLSAAVTRSFADGNVSPAELRGTPFVLNIWASWCVPCREEAPALGRGWTAARRAGVLFLGLNQQDVTEDARRFMRDFKIDYPNVRDPGDDTQRRYGATGIPETYFVDRRGRIVGHVIGEVSDAQLSQGMAAAANGHVVSAEEGGAHTKPR